MASYTMPLMNLIDGYTQFSPQMSTRERIEEGRKKLFDFDYPFFDEGLRKDFETHFIRNFYTREIGYETEGLFKFQLETWLQINMPFFNQLLKSETLSFNPLENVNVGISSNLKNQKDQNDVIDRVEDETSNETGKRDIDTVSNEKNKTDETTVSTDHIDTTSNTQTTQNTSSHTDETSENKTTGKSDVTRSQNSETDTVDNNFDRNIFSDTPQSRLELTSNDGTGVIEYASNIKENKEKNVGNKKDAMTGEEHGTSSGTNDTTNSSDTTVEQTGTQNTVASSDETENVERHLTSETDKTSNVDDAHVVDQTKNKVGNQKLDSAIQVLEDYAKREIGKTGGMTYSQMLTEYRSTFLRIERDIFNEMNELFMLVY